MKHTPEPWVLNKRASGNIEDSNRRSVAACHGYSTNTDNGEHVDENDANAARIVACVNACKGIENPEDLRRQRDELQEIIEKARPEYIRLTNNHVGTNDGNCFYEADSKIMNALDSVFEYKGAL